MPKLFRILNEEQFFNNLKILMNCIPIFLLLLPFAGCVGSGTQVAMPRTFGTQGPMPRTSTTLVPGRYLAQNQGYPDHHKIINREAHPDYLRLDIQFVSQRWSPPGLESNHPVWKHLLRIYIPTEKVSSTCLLRVGGGTGHPSSGTPSGPYWPPTGGQAMAVEHGAVVAELMDVPNQSLLLGDQAVGHEEREDALVAHSWNHSLANPEIVGEASIHLPMMRSVVAALDLIQMLVVKDGARVDDFVLTGVSKRGWAVWLAAIHDRRVKAIVPSSADFWNIEANFRHIHSSYAKVWPPAMKDYEHYVITDRLLRGDPELSRSLFSFEDPVRYQDPSLRGQFDQRLAIPKIILSASGDDFSVPDSPQFFLGAFKPPPFFRAFPNQPHYVDAKVMEHASSRIFSRLLKGQALPKLDSAWRKEGTLQFSVGERPAEVKLWKAINPLSRDFRFNAGIRYSSEPVLGGLVGKQWHYSVQIPVPEQGWSAQFLEATFSDGLVLTTPIAVWPMRYPSGAEVTYPD